MSLKKVPGALFSPGETISGFKINNVTALPEINARAYQMYHKQSGGHLLYLHSNDEENLFSVAFKTPPHDDTGLPHILEHTVLCGSKKYPVKDPFVELLKTSLATFLNAMTYPDKTVYPCASMNEADFHNLINVYCDAVFFPAVTESHFKQEGHHLDFTEPGNIDSSLCIKGVVYNEMKGVYSDLNGIINKEEAKSLFPVNAYGKDSGGCPDAIPNLTYEDFVNFHKTYYHPSNAYFFVYGGFDIKNTLKIIDNGYLSKFKKITVDSEIGDEPKWKEPIRKTVRYPISKNESMDKKTAVTINFLTNKLTETIDSLSMSVIENYMLDNPSSPLRKALIDSKLGDALTSSGYADYQRDTYFTVGLKGAEEKNTDKIIKLVFDTFKKVVDKGINKDKLESSFHRIEFHSKEILSSYPIILMDRIYNYWLYGADPLSLLKLNSYLEKLRKIYAEDSRHFEKMIEKKILRNPHYSVLTFIPDKNYFIDRDSQHKNKMNELKADMSKKELTKISLEAIELEKMHLTANSPEALATLPRLSITDIPKKPQVIDREIIEVEGRPFIVSNVFSNEINYVNFAFDLRGIDEDLIDYLPIFKVALLGMGAAGFTYAEMAEREAAVSGGVTAGLLAEGRFDDPDDCFPYFSISSKALDSKFEGMLDIIKDRLLRADFNNTSRLRDIIIQRKTLLRGSILSSGSGYATLFAGRNLNLNHSISDRFGGISHIRFISELADNYDYEKSNIVEKLKRIQKLILNKNRFYISFVGSENKKKILNEWYKGIIQASSCEQIACMKQSVFSNAIRKNIITIPSNVAFNGAVFRAAKATEQNAAALLLLSQSLSYGYLWEEIRAKKGAYGARASYSTLGGSFSFSTYRDPCIKESYNTFDKVFEFIDNKMNLNAKAVEQEIIGSVKRLDRPVRPGEVVGISMARYLRNISDEYREGFREELLCLDGKKIKGIVLNVLKPAYHNASMCTIAGKNMLQKYDDFIKLSKFELEDL